MLSAPWLDLPDAVRRIKALEGFKTHPDAGRLVTAFKRVSNILKSVEPGEGGPDPALLTEPAEAALEKARAEIAPVMEERRKLGEYAGAFEALASIKDRIDSFFDEVMVMVEDEKIKRNRLKLLASVRDLYSGIADLSKLTV